MICKIKYIYVHIQNECVPQFCSNMSIQPFTLSINTFYTELAVMFKEIHTTHWNGDRGGRIYHQKNNFEMQSKSNTALSLYSKENNHDVNWEIEILHKEKEFV